MSEIQEDDFSKSKFMELPRSVAVGHGVLKELPKVCKKMKLFGPSLVVCDEGTKKVAGDSVKEMLIDDGLESSIFLIKDASMDTVEELVKTASEDKASYLLGVGGGRPIDVAKLSSFELGIPFISVPTAASHDGIVSGTASIILDGRRTSMAAHTPLAVVADTRLIAGSPHRMLAAGCGDIISNLTAVKDWLLAKEKKGEYFSTSAATLSEMTAKLFISDAENIKPGSEESAWRVVKALVSSGVAMSIAGSSRPASGSEHKFSHALDMLAEKPAYHGEQCGVGTIMMMHLHGGDWKSIKNALMQVGAPTTAKELEIDPGLIIEALTQAHKIKSDRYTIIEDKGLDRDAAERLARDTGVID